MKIAIVNSDDQRKMYMEVIFKTIPSPLKTISYSFTHFNESSMILFIKPCMYMKFDKVHFLLSIVRNLIQLFFLYLVRLYNIPLSMHNLWVVILLVENDVFVKKYVPVL